MAKDGGERLATNAHISTPDVFISYASQDTVVAATVVEALERSGIACWIAPRDVTPGAFYADEIVHAIDASKAIVLILSKNAADSQHVLREVERAASKRHPVVSLRIDQAPLPPGLEYFLNTSQWLDASSGDVARSMLKLIAAVRVAVQAPVVTPETAPTPRAPAPSTPARSSKRTAIIVTSLMGLAITWFAIDRLWLSGRGAAPTSVPTAAVPSPAPAPAAPTIPEKSVAVLPFADMSEKKDQEYFADGMAEEVIDLLAKVPGLHVPARTSSFYFKGKSTKIPDVAREIRVAHVLEGSVRRSGNRIRVTAQLVRADTGYYLWSETYDRDIHDVFKVQDDIANSVVQALQITLMGGPLRREEGGTHNLDAYQLYLQAVSLVRQNTRQSLEAANGCLNQAIKLDPTFGLAWAEMARVEMAQTDNSYLLPAQGFERARQHARHALQLSAGLKEAHSVLQYVHRTYDWDWAASEAEGRQVLSTDSTNPTALVYAGMLAYTLGRADDAVRLLRASLDRDPVNTQTIFSLGIALYLAGRFADAEATYRKLLQIEPSFSWTHEYLAKTLLAEGKPDLALAMAEQEAEEVNRLDILPIVLEAAGRKAEADEALNTLSTKYANTEAFFVAMSYAYRNDHDLALQWLDRAYKQKDDSLVEIVGEPLFKNLADDPRYKAFLRKMNLPE
ncbi:MAG: TIR domain-containing protein [Steroidobacteraceae bacterium]